MTNTLVAQMPDDVAREISVAGGEFSLGPGRALPQESLDGSFVFVVEGGIASKFLRSDIGHYSEIAMVGREGMFPIGGLLNVPGSPHLVLSQVGVLSGRRIRSREFHSIISESAEADAIVRRYVYAFITQCASNMQTRDQDRLEKRVARWLLMCHDRINHDVIEITHEMMAQMVFAQRPTITNLLNDFRSAGIVDLTRGRIHVLDRAELYRIADGSYGLSERYYSDQIHPFGKGIGNPASAVA